MIHYAKGELSIMGLFMSYSKKMEILMEKQWHARIQFTRQYAENIPEIWAENTFELRFN